MTNYMRTGSFLHHVHADFTESMKVVENCLKKANGENSFLKRTYEGRSICNENSPVYPKVLYLHTL